MRRFERIHDVVEPVEEYRAGGYHPVHLHDLFIQRYEVIGKLAYGQFSTVWLANDQRLQRYVVLKILKATSSEDSKELGILLHLSDASLEHPGKRHVLELLDHFEHDGPNGTHLCLVFPVMMSDGEAMTIEGNPRQATHVRAISNQILLGLDFLHGLGIIHGDLQPANIMVSMTGDMSWGVSLQSPEYSPVEWLEGDMGGAMWNVQRDKWPVTPTALRAPELIHRDLWNSSIDVWALGCLIFQLATNEPLFPVGSFGLTAHQINEEHELLIRKILEDEGPMHSGFEAYLSGRLPSNYGVQNVELLTLFLRSMLRRDPEARNSTTQLLNHPFLAGKMRSRRQ